MRTAIRKALLGRVGVCPAGRQAVRIDHQAAFGQAVGNIRCAGECRLARSRLCSLLCCNPAGRQLEVANGSLKLRIGLLLLRQRIRDGGRELPVGQPSCGRCSVLS